MVRNQKNKQQPFRKVRKAKETLLETSRVFGIDKHFNKYVCADSGARGAHDIKRLSWKMAKKKTCLILRCPQAD